MKLKRLLGAIVVVTLLISAFPLTAVASGASATDKALIRMGLSQEQLTWLSPEYKEHLVAELGPKGKIISIKREAGLAQPSSGEISPMTLDPSSFYITTLTATPSYSPTGEIDLYVSSSWEWYTAPVNVLTDSNGIAWASDLPLYLKQGTSHFRYNARLEDGTTRIYDQYTPTDQTAGTGFGFDFDIIGWVSGPIFVTHHSGWTEGYLYRYDQNTGTPITHFGNVVSRYFHQEVNPIGSLTFSKTPSVGITNLTSYNPSNSPGANLTWSE